MDKNTDNGHTVRLCNRKIQNDDEIGQKKDEKTTDKQKTETYSQARLNKQCPKVQSTIERDDCRIGLLFGAKLDKPAALGRSVRIRDNVHVL